MGGLMSVSPEMDVMDLDMVTEKKPGIEGTIEMLKVVDDCLVIE